MGSNYKPLGTIENKLEQQIALQAQPGLRSVAVNNQKTNHIRTLFIHWPTVFVSTLNLIFAFCPDPARPSSNQHSDRSVRYTTSKKKKHTRLGDQDLPQYILFQYYWKPMLLIWEKPQALIHVVLC